MSFRFILILKVNLINDENRLVLAVGDVLPDKVLQLKDHIMGYVLGVNLI